MTERFSSVHGLPRLTVDQDLIVTGRVSPPKERDSMSDERPENINGVKNVPLQLGWNHLIGRMDLDYGTGDFKGNIFDRQYLDVLGSGLYDRLLNFSFCVSGGNLQGLRDEHDDYLNITKGLKISKEIQALRQMQKDLKDTFYHRELDGGPKAALTHPLYLAAERRITRLQEEMTLLV
jgi:hypothetical protein